MESPVDVAVIGAGFCGLGAGAALRTRRVGSFAVLEQGERVGHFWTTTYDRIHLHSAWHDLPNDGGLRRRYPIFLSRDELLRYFNEYAERFELGPHLQFGTRVGRVAHVDGASSDGCNWLLETTRGRLRARYVVVATAVNRVPKEPALAGRETFRGRVLHSSAYRNAGSFAGRKVLVVGSGNSAAEIALDLGEGGARDVAMWVRAPRHFIPLVRMARLFRVARFFGAFSPSKLAAQHAITRGTPEFDKLIDARDRIASRFSVDLSAYGIRRPAQGPLAETFRKGRIPTFDVGAIPKIRSGAIRVIDGNLRPLECLEEDGVRLGGTLERVDDVVLATGFEPRLQEFLADDDLLGVLPGFGVGLLPLTDGRSRSRIRPSIFFPGFDLTPLGGVSLGRWGWEAGERIADELAASRSAGNAAQKEARTASPALTAALTMR